MTIDEFIRTIIATYGDCTLTAEAIESTRVWTDYVNGQKKHRSQRTIYSRNFVMSGPKGVHTLKAEHTDIGRLSAHWKGFCEANNVGCTGFNGQQRAFFRTKPYRVITH